MAITSFIPNVWSARLLDNLNKNLVFAQLCNRNYEGEIQQFGDTVHITNLTDITVKSYTANVDIADPDQLTTGDTPLVIDHGTYFNFYLNDVDKAQARGDLMDAAMRSASYKMADDTDSYIINTLSAATSTSKGNAKSVSNITPADAYGLVVDIKTALDKAHVPLADRWLAVDPAFEGLMLKDSRFIQASNAGENRLQNGAVARAAGFNIYVSGNLSGDIYAGIPDAVTFAQQIAKVEAYRREKGFDDGVKGLSLCGAKVLREKGIYKLSYTIATAQ